MSDGVCEEVELLVAVVVDTLHSIPSLSQLLGSCFIGSSGLFGYGGGPLMGSPGPETIGPPGHPGGPVISGVHMISGI